jgi:hypothetical protein
MHGRPNVATQSLVHGEIQGLLESKIPIGSRAATTRSAMARLVKIDACKESVTMTTPNKH